MTTNRCLIRFPKIDHLIYMIRNQKVMLDKDAAQFYGISMKHMNNEIRRKLRRFPSDFMFPLSMREYESLRSQLPTLEHKLKEHPRYLPHVFTEQGLAMLSSTLNSKRAIEINVEIMRAFVRLPHLLASHEDFARELSSLERKYDAQFKTLFQAIRKLMTTSSSQHRWIGFNA